MKDLLFITNITKNIIDTYINVSTENLEIAKLKKKLKANL